MLEGVPPKVVMLEVIILEDDIDLGVKLDHRLCWRSADLKSKHKIKYIKKRYPSIRLKI